MCPTKKNKAPGLKGFRFQDPPNSSLTTFGRIGKRAGVNRALNAPNSPASRTLRISVSGVRWLQLPGEFSLLPRLSLHFVAQRYHAALVGMDLGQMKGDVLIELFEERDALSDQDR